MQTSDYVETADGGEIETTIDNILGTVTEVQRDAYGRTVHTRASE